MSFGDKLLNSFFQSVTARTAGYNSVDMESLHGATKLLMIVLMFIGTAPGSTGGGIKVTTFVVLLMTIVCVTRGAEETSIRGKRISQSTVYKAMAITGIAGFAVVLSTCIIFFSMNEATHISGIDALFESVSAFATVGLTAGVSGVANTISKIALVLTMFLAVWVRFHSLCLWLCVPPKIKHQVMPEGKILVG